MHDPPNHTRWPSNGGSNMPVVLDPPNPPETGHFGISSTLASAPSPCLPRQGGQDQTLEVVKAAPSQLDDVLVVPGGAPPPFGGRSRLPHERLAAMNFVFVRMLDGNVGPVPEKSGAGML
jgi:hypothetical protein